MAVNILISELGDKFQDYRKDIPGDSYNWGPSINQNDIQYFTFHHSVTKQTAKNDGNWKAECDTIANGHINTNGWGGVGYRFIIASDGTVAYVGDLSHGGSAVANKNNIMFSTCLVGDFTKELPTASQIHSAHLLAKFFLTQAPAYPNLNTWDDIKGHRDFMATTCPGDFWRLPGGLRERILGDVWQGYPDPQPSVVTPPTPPTDPNLVIIEQLKKELEEVKRQLANKIVEFTQVKNKLDEIKAIVG